MEERNNKIIELKSAMTDPDGSFHSKFANYRPDDELLQSTTRIKNQRDVILDRIEKMETSRERVNHSVYEKVKRDYSLQLQTITELLDEKKANLKKEIKDLYLRREKLTVEINRHKDILEEAEFRHFLGEFSQNQFQEVQNYESKEIDKLEGDLSRISQFIRAHEDLFDPEDLGQHPAPKPQVQHAEVTKTVQREVPNRSVPAPQAPKAEPQPAVQQSQPQADVTSPRVDAQPQKKTLETSSLDKTSSNVDLNEFEDLFTDDEESNVSKQKLAQSQSNIKSIIAATADDEESVSDLIPKPEDANEDYFKDEQVNEASFTVKKHAIDVEEKSEVTPHNEVVNPPLPTSKRAPDIETDVVTKSGSVDDSISDILDSINLDDDDVAPKPQKPPTKPSSATSASAPTDSPAEAYVMRVIEGDLDQNQYTMKENISIGRSSSNDIVLKAPKVSRQHAAINMYNSQFIIIDLKSSNGVYVNGARVDEAVLKLGDEVSIGGYRFAFELKG